MIESSNQKSYFNSNSFKIKVYFLCFLFTIDIIFNSFTQFIAFGSRDSIRDYNINYNIKPLAHSYFLFCIQLLIQLLMLFTTLSLFWNTFYFQLGMVGKVCSRFKFSFILTALYPITFVLERVSRLTMLSVTHQVSDISIWRNGLYVTFYFLKYIVAFIYYIYTLDATLELGKAKYYRPDNSLFKKIKQTE